MWRLLLQCTDPPALVKDRDASNHDNRDKHMRFRLEKSSLGPGQTLSCVSQASLNLQTAVCELWVVFFFVVSNKIGTSINPKTHWGGSEWPLAEMHDDLQIGYTLRASCVTTLHLREIFSDKLAIGILFMEPLSHLSTGGGEREPLLCSLNGIVRETSPARSQPISNIWDQLHFCDHLLYF